MLRCDSQAEKTPPPCDTRLTISLLNQARSWLNGQGQGVLLVKHLKDVWLVRGVPSGTSMIATPPDSPKASDPHSGLISPCLREVFSQTGADSRVLKTDGEDMQNRDHPCFFSSTHAAKDSGIALMIAGQAAEIAQPSWLEFMAGRPSRSDSAPPACCMCRVLCRRKHSASRSQG